MNLKKLISPVQSFSSQNEGNKMLFQLTKMALPVIATMFLNMAYNFVNMIFVGRLGSDAVAAIGTASFYLHLGWAISSIITVGAGIKIAHAMGKNNPLLAKSYVRSGRVATLLVAIVYMLVIICFGNFFIGFIKLNNLTIESAAIKYLSIASLSLPFVFLNLFYANVFIGYGNSRTPFRISFIGLMINVTLDPILIFLAGWGIYGAAIASIIAQAIVTALYMYNLKHYQVITTINISFRKTHLKEMVILGLSPTLQRVVFTFVAIAMARIISNWGSTAIAVQKVGVQIEALSYMTVAGFSTALTTISGQAFGAKQYNKQWLVFLAGIKIAFIIGLITTSLFLLFPGQLFSIFLNDKGSLEMGINYLIILGFSQLFMCIELLSTGAFYGWGKTYLPAIISVSLTMMRVPLAYILTTCCSPKLNTVWWSISISSIAKGLILTSLFIILYTSFLKHQNIQVLWKQKKF